MSNAESIQKLRKETLSIIKSCLASSNGNLSIEQLQQDYKQLVGESIPITKLQCGTLSNFLSSFPKDIEVIQRGYSIFVNSVASSETRHIENLVKTQKKASRKRPPPRFMRRPVNSARWVPAPRFLNSARGSSRFTNSHRYMSAKPELPPLIQNFNQQKFPNITSLKRQPLSNPQPNSNFQSKKVATSVSQSTHFQFSKPNNNFANPSEKLTSCTSLENDDENVTYDPILERRLLKAKSVVKPTQNGIEQINKPLQKDFDLISEHPNYEQTNNNKPLQNDFDRISKHQNCEEFIKHSQNYKNNHQIKPTVLSINNSCAGPINLQHNSFESSKEENEEIKQSYKQKLAIISAHYKLNINYETIPVGQKKIHYICKLSVKDTKFSENFSSYPVESKSSLESEEIVAQKACEFLKEKLVPLSPTIVFTETQDANIIVQRLRELLTDEVDGIFWENLQRKYGQHFQESVPVDWVKTELANNAEDISILNPVADFYILSLKKNIFSLSLKNRDDTIKTTAQCLPPIQQLPDDRMWNVFVSYIKGCGEIWFRLIGEQHSDAYEELVTDMELFYMEKSNQISVSSPDIDSFYACYHDDLWFRVQVKDINNDKVKIFFIDHGDYEDIELSNLYILDPNFLKLPCQSILCSLYGVECGFEDQNVLSVLDNLALGKSLVADVVPNENGISVVLYDTSTEEDININEKILQMLHDSFPEPSLPSKGGLCEVYISHVTSDGDIYVTLESASFKTLETLMFTARKHATEILGENAVEIDLTKLYLAKFSEDGEWHRAAPRTVNKNINGEVLLKSIDKGFCECVASANIIPLENLSELTCQIPAQAIPCKLHNVPSASDAIWTARTTERLKSILLSTDGSPLLLKVISEATAEQMAQVQIFQRIKPQNLLVSINQSLDLESELFSNEDKNNNLSSDCSSNELDTGSSSSLKKLSPSISGEELDMLELSSPDLPQLNKFFDICIAYAASPNNFAVQDLKSITKLEMLMGEMNSFYSLASNRQLVEKIYEGGYYALLHRDSVWYRVHVHQVMGGQISGLFTDFGDFFCASPENIQPLWPNFRKLNQQSFKASLSGVVPTNGDWTPEDCLRFRKLVEGKELVSVVVNIKKPEDKNCSSKLNYRKEPPILELQLINTSDDNEDVFIHDLLIQEKRAKSSINQAVLL